MDGIDHKLARMRKHRDDYIAVAQPYVASEPVTVDIVQDPETGMEEHIVRVHAEPSPELALITADLVHNARSALDHVAYRLVETNGATPTEHTFFPITSQETGWGRTARNALRGATQEARDNVRAMRPWKGGNEALWQLHHLDIVDKHRLLLLTFFMNSGLIIGGEEIMPFPDDFPGQTLRVPEITLRVADPEQVYDGFVAFRQPIDGGGLPGFANPKVRMELGLGPGSELTGMPIGPIIEQFMTAVEDVVAQLRSGGHLP